MALIPLVDLAHLAALLGIAPHDPNDTGDLAVLRDLLARRTALAAQNRHKQTAPTGEANPPILHIVRDQ
jgi:hypothetical protein